MVYYGMLENNLFIMTNSSLLRLKMDTYPFVFDIDWSLRCRCIISD